MKKRAAIYAVALSAFLSCMSMRAAAYNELTHSYISNFVARKSVLYSNPALLADWGYSTSTLFSAIDHPVVLDTIANIVGFGAFHEDNLSQIKRPYNHFFDPQNGGRGLDFANITGHPSPLWTLEDLGAVTSIEVNGWLIGSAGGVPQNYSFRDAQERFFTALTHSNPGTRLTEFGNVFLTLGQVIHHLQDMGQPQHVRNEIHPTGDLYGGWYENYTRDKYNAEGIESLLESHAYNGGVPPVFATAREFWAQPQIPGPRFRGMADFTAKNYVGLRTNFRTNVAANGSVTISASPGFALPNGINRDGSAMTLVSQTVPVQMLNGSIRTTTMRYVMGQVYDEYTGLPPQMHKLASESIFGQPTGVIGGSGQVPLSMATNSAVFDDNHPVLLPRAAAFSTGLINHFFRGRLDLFRTTPTATNWSILNAGTQPMNGQFYIYREDSAGNRVLAAGPFARSVAAGVTTVVPVPEPPSSTYRMVVAFRGQIGAEGDPSGSGFVSVAGKVVPFNPQTIPCGSAFNAEGSSEGRETIMELGSSSGTVRGEFEAYNIPDSLVIRRSSASGPVLFSTGGLVPRFHEFSFSHPGGTDPATNRVWIKVTGNADAGTRWTAVLTCPGGSITNAIRPEPRINISFGSTASGRNIGCGRGYFDFYLNDTYAAGTVISVPWGGGQAATSNSFLVTAGPNHNLRIVKRTTEPSQPTDVGCGGPSKPMLNKGTQQYDVSTYIVAPGQIIIQ
jgi:hypothetical protein